MHIVNTSLCTLPSRGKQNLIQVVVLTQDEAGLYAVYMGGALGDDDGLIERDDLDYVVHSGIKLGFRQAVAHFPGLTYLEYRK